ncbi:MAG: signal recognition particle-docking protein FtsY [Clostridia bacterium]|nr:signal recognition particle-docking protein FtsY [Clostridia bacterium]MBQ3092966.1 signal recognition particle-docking protein FtsY [Clostridia bacterium]
MKFFEKIKESLKKTRDNISGKISNIINLFTKIDEDFFEELEEILISSDVGMKTSEIICNKLREEVKKSGITDPKEIKNILINIITELLEDNNSKLNINTKPSIILVVGVNGVGKTTSIAKLAYNLQNQDKKVILAAGDTFRAAAVEQLDIWARLIDCPIVKQPEGSDSASVIYDTICSAKAHNSDVIICDTAGRLHNKQNLMRELEKINKIISRELPESNKEILLVLDASTGQNGLNQAIEFKKILNLTGIILTKLDGTARGGIILAIKNQLELPVKYIGLGEDLESLKEFNAREFSEALFSEI